MYGLFGFAMKLKQESGLVIAGDRAELFGAEGEAEPFVDVKEAELEGIVGIAGTDDSLFDFATKFKRESGLVSAEGRAELVDTKEEPEGIREAEPEGIARTDDKSIGIETEELLVRKFSSIC